MFARITLLTALIAQLNAYPAEGEVSASDIVGGKEVR